MKIPSILFHFFPDYSRNFIQTETFWLIVGLCITFGTIISVIPQIIIILKKKSSLGLSEITIFLTSIGQFILVINVLCFDTNAFAGFFQFRFSWTFSTYLTFLNLFLLWLCYFFIVFLKIIFISEKENRFRPIFFIILTILLSILILFIYYFIGIIYGFNSSEIRKYGTFLGSTASMLVYCQYLPQFITTISLKGPGSLSLLTLEIQAPGGLMNALFMWIGQGHHWSTWLSLMIAAIQQFILLFICFYFQMNKEKDTQSGFTDIDLELGTNSNLYTNENKARLMELGFEFDSDDIPLYHVVPINSDGDDHK